jgi:hypothetical protein
MVVLVIILRLLRSLRIIRLPPRSAPFRLELGEALLYKDYRQRQFYHSPADVSNSLFFAAQKISAYRLNSRQNRGKLRISGKIIRFAVGNR